MRQQKKSYRSSEEQNPEEQNPKSSRCPGQAIEMAPYMRVMLEAGRKSMFWPLKLGAVSRWATKLCTTRATGGVS